MATPYLDHLVATGDLKLPAKVTLEDFKMLYALALKKRGFHVENDAVPEAEEQFVLVALCRIDLPEKAADFRNGMCATLSNYHGVAQNRTLQDRFVDSLSPRFIRARRIKDIPLVSIRSIFGHTRPRPRPAT